MLPRTLNSRRLVFLGSALLATGGVVSAQAPSASPFMPPQAAVSNTPTAGAPLEFRGFMETGEGMRFRLFDPARKTGSWVKLNERDTTLDVLAKQFTDTPNAETLVVEHQGRTLTLAQRVSKVVSSGSAAQNIAPPPQPTMTNVPPAVTQAVVVNPTPADEARRLEAVASEVARRRALREQASQQMGQGAPPVPQQPQMQPVQRPQGNVPPGPGGPQPNRN